MISLLPTRAQGALTPTEAGKTLVAARAMLDDLESLASGGEFDVLRRRLRAGALGSVRAACTVRYSELLGGSRKAAEAAYHELVSALERLDFAALSASRMAAANGASVALQVKTVEEKFDKFLNATEQ